MKTFALSTIIVLFSLAGCDKAPERKVEVNPPARPGNAEVNAPGVHVDAERGKGVEVEAPGVKVETPPSQK